MEPLERFAAEEVELGSRKAKAVAIARKLIGATDPAEAAPGTIRGDFGLELDANVIHGSDSPASAEREIGIFFG